MPEASRVKIDPALGAIPAGCVSLKVYREKAGRWVPLEREPDDEGGAVLPYFGLDEVPMADANAFASWAREKWGPGVYRLQFWTESGGRRKMAGTGRAVTVGAASKKAKKKGSKEEAPASPQSVLEVQLREIDKLRAQLEEERREVREKRDRLVEQQLANEREHHRQILELVMHRASAPAAAGLSPAEVELRIKLATIEATQVAQREFSRQLERAERRRQEEEEEGDAPDPEDNSELAQVQRLMGIAEKLGVLDALKPTIAGLLGAKGQA